MKVSEKAFTLKNMPLQKLFRRLLLKLMILKINDCQSSYYTFKIKHLLKLLKKAFVKPLRLLN